MPHLPPRPRWNDRRVKEAAALEIFDRFQEWSLGCGAVDEEHDARQLRALLAIALIESNDAYMAGRYLDDSVGFPTNGELIHLLMSAYGAMPYLTEPFVHEWVMKHQVRFAAKKGDMVRFRVGAAEITGTIVGVSKCCAKGYAEVTRSKGQIIPVMAEDVIENLGPAPEPRRKDQKK